ncbi:MAG: ABC transporter permease [Clostridia bacterium]
MTIIGIAGCTGLMLTGFGIRDSIIDIPNTQYKEIFVYDSAVTLLNTDNLDKIEKYIENNDNIQAYSELCANTGKLKGEDKSYDTTIYVPDKNEDFEKMCNLKEYKTGEKLELRDDGVIITDKVSEFLGVQTGDEITLVDGNNKEYQLKVVGIAQNYVSNYIYMTKEYYNSKIKEFNINMILLKASPNISEQNLSQISEELLNINGVATVTVISTLMSSISDMLGTLNYVVIILVVASALLDFVVLYNLANINIGERQREIATLKVLGFYDKEVDNYINKENIIFTIIGICLGLIFGYFLTDGVVASVEIDKLKFIRQVAPISYVYSAVITAVFSIIVNKVIHFVLKKIDMIESLKSVE